MVMLGGSFSIENPGGVSDIDSQLVSHEVLAQKQLCSEEQLHSSQVALDTIIDNARPLLDSVKKIKFFKYLDSTWSECNQSLVKFSRLQSKNNIIGRKDEDLPWAEGSKFFKSVDQSVFSGTEKSILMNVRVASGEVLTAYQRKMPICDLDGKVVGLMAEMEEVTSGSYALLPDIVNLYDDAIFADCGPREAKYLMQRYITYGLSHRESECLFYLVRGLSVKSIARKMEISHRTVEKFVSHLKQKLCCANKSDLVERIYKDGAVHIIPPRVDFNYLAQYQNKKG